MLESVPVFAQWPKHSAVTNHDFLQRGHEYLLFVRAVAIFRVKIYDFNTRRVYFTHNSKQFWMPTKKFKVAAVVNITHWS